MTKFIIKNKNNKTIAHIFCFTDYKNRKYKSKKDFINCLIEHVLETPEVGYAGFEDKANLHKHLMRAVFGWDKFNGVIKNNFDNKTIQNILDGVLEKCHEKLQSKPTYVFIFPNFNKLKKDRMNGIGGFCSWKNTILIDINQVKGWRNALKKTLCHEFHHSVIAVKRNPPTWTLLEGLVYEGMADNFAESITGKASVWTRALSKKECLDIFHKIEKLLNRSNEKVYQQVFFGRDEKYPFWAGYSIGYNLVKSHLKNNSDLNWNEISKLKPEEVLNGSDFTKSNR